MFLPRSRAGPSAHASGALVPGERLRRSGWGLCVTISKGSQAHHAFMTTVIGAIMLGLEPIVFLVGGVYAAMVYSGIVGTLRT
jgi:hypothetical protein